MPLLQIGQQTSAVPQCLLSFFSLLLLSCPVSSGQLSFYLLSCSSLSFFSLHLGELVTCLSRVALTKSSLVKETLVTSPTFRRWSVITLCGINVLVVMTHWNVGLEMV